MPRSAARAPSAAVAYRSPSMPVSTAQTGHVSTFTWLRPGVTVGDRATANEGGYAHRGSGSKRLRLAVAGSHRVLPPTTRASRQRRGRYRDGHLPPRDGVT